MTRVLLTIAQAATAAFILLAAGCMSAARSASDPAADHSAEAAEARGRYAGSGGQTFLDTLNQGKEVALAASDLPALETMPPAVNEGPATRTASRSSESYFRIQILASSQVDMVRKEKVNAEATLKHPVFMISEQSLYKLYVGDFKTKSEAESALPDVRNKGYKDAWIVSTKPIGN